MAINDNTSYELFGYQVKDLATKIKSKAEAASLASVATSGLYSDLIGAPTIPTVYNGKLTITQNGTAVGEFTANQSTDTTIDLTGGSSYTPGNGIDITNDEISVDTSIVATQTDLDDYVTIATAQNVTGQKTFKDVTNIQNGQGTGSLWVGGNVNASGATNNNRHLARIVAPSYANASLGATMLGFDTSGDSDMHVANKTYDALSFGGMKKITNATSPMAIGFCVTNTRGATAASNKVYPLEMDASEARFNVQPNFAGVNLATTNDIPGDMTGATSSVAGVHGLVPAPSAGDQDKVLTGDGTWKALTNVFYPVGSIYMSATLSTAADVEAALGGTWVAWGAGRVPIGVNTSDTDFDTAEETGGSKTHQHNLSNAGWAKGAVSSGVWKYAEISTPAYGVSWQLGGTGGSASGTISYATGLGGKTDSGSTMPPYITCYMYKRVA